MKTYPVWWKNPPEREPARTSLPSETDFAVVGAGFAGLSAALAVARAGRRVTIIEKARAGHGAATRNAGFVSSELKGGYLGLEARFGKRRAGEFMAEAAAAQSYMLDRIESEQIQCSLVKSGRLILAAKPSHYQAMSRECEFRARQFNSTNTMLSQTDLRSEVSSDNYCGGWLTPDAHALNPMQFHAGLLERVRTAGAEIVEESEVTAIAGQHKAFELSASRGKLKARDVFVATHGYGGNELPWLKRRVINFGWYAIATEAMPRERLQQLLPKSRCYANSNQLFNYFRVSPDGTQLVFGGRAPILEMAPQHAAHFLKIAMHRIFPDLADTQVSHAWSGQIAFSFDLLPHIGNHKGIHYATAFTGPGMPLANYLGDKVARKVLGQSGSSSVFEAVPLVARPYYWGRPWFMPGAMLWYAAKDWIGR